MKRTLFVRLTAQLLLVLVFATKPAAAELESTALQIPPQPLADALRQFAETVGLQIIYEAKLTEGAVSSGAGWTSEGLPPDNAEILDMLLRATGLEYRFVNERTVTLRRINRPQSVDSGAVAAGSGGPEIIENIIVTGVGDSGWQTRFDASYAISALDAETINRRQPRGLAETLSEVPGIFVESTGGTLGNNVYFRGLPNDNYRYVRILEDGLPTFEEGAGTFTNADIFTRIDSTVERIEVARSSSAAVTTSNAPGSTVNIISRRGTPSRQGILVLAVGNHDLYRIDANLSGPVRDDVLYHIGGYQLSDGGIRDPGFTANRGGQLRAGLEFPLGDNHLYISFKRIDDHNTFYPALPMASNKRGLSGLDPTDASMISGDFAGVSIYDGDGQRADSIDLSDAVETRVNTLNLFLSRELGDWQLSNKLRNIRGDIHYNAVLFGGNGFEELNDELAALQAVAPDTTDLRYRYVNGGGGLLQLDQLPHALLVDQGLWKSDISLDNWINDLRITRNIVLDGGGSNELTLGLYYSQFDQRQSWNWQAVVTEARHQPRLLDIVGVNINGEPTMNYTEDGIWNHHSNLQSFRDDVVHRALYLVDTWQINDTWRLDLGARYQAVRKRGRVAETRDVDLGNPSTIADDQVAVFTGTTKPYYYRDEKLAWTLGINYRAANHLSYFARYSEAFRFTPEFAQWFDCCQPTEAGIVLEEVGLKYNVNRFSAYLVAFSYDFPDIAVSNQRVDERGNIVTETASAAAEALGVEWELNWLATENLELQFSGFYQSIRYQNFDPGADISADGAGFVNFSGNQILRQPQSVMTLRPTLYWGEREHQLFGALHYTGLRYTDAANSVKLPAYWSLDAGLVFNLSQKLQVHLLATNLTNEIGLTEGSPRGGAIATTPSQVFYGRPIFGRDIRLTARLTF